MKKKTKYFNKICLWIFVLGVMIQTGGFTQSVKLNTRYVSEGTVKEITIPNDRSFARLYVEIKGGDGGDASIGKCRKHGGSGVTVKAEFKIGNDGIPSGSTIRFIRGYKGGSDSMDPRVGYTFTAGGGGGGSAVLYRKPGHNDWEILAVAGGGGGAYSRIENWFCTEGYHGKGANTATYGDNGGFKTAGGTEGGAGESVKSKTGTKYSGGGSGAFEGASLFGGKQGYPAGGKGGNCKKCEKGGFGFGGGGAAIRYGGGGGGYSGGGAGYDESAGGGGSYLNSLSTGYIMLEGIKGAGKKQDGFVRYEFGDIHRFFKEVRSWTIHPAIDRKKCLDVDGSKTGNGTRIQLWDCKTYHEGKNQRWIINDYVLKSKLDYDKCLDLKKSNTHNGTDIQLWDCNGSKAQRWIYDGVSRQLRYLENWNKCMDFHEARTYNGTHIKIWECKDIHAHRWTIDYANTAHGNGKVKRIHLAKDENKCLDLYDARTAKGTKVQLWKCSDHVAQQWLFDGVTIRFNAQKNKCLDLKKSNTSNGTDIQLWDCNGTQAQQWVYEGITGTIRSRRDPGKCLDAEGGNTAEGTRIQLYDCHSWSHQQWIIKEPCTHDTVPPVAKCRNFTYTGGLIAPTADTIDDGSYDECGIASRDITQVTGDTWKLTVKDARGNTSSCTATITKR